MTDTKLLDTPFGSFQLLRRPRRRNEVLQAWDAADSYLLNQLAEQNLPPQSRILIVNDSFGALSCALAKFDCSHWSDSVSAQLACCENAHINTCREPEFIASTDLPEGPFDRIIYRLPRSHSLMRYQLERLRPLLRAPEHFVAATMAKYLNASTLALIGESLGEAQASLAWKKARLVTVNSLCTAPEGHSDDWEVTRDDGLGVILGNHANVFSRGKFDRGSRVLLDALPKLPLHRDASAHIADLGCGNGLLGVVAARHWRNARVEFFDESHLAVSSARRNVLGNLEDSSRCGFHRDDCMSGYSGPPFDLVLCNPPFHQEQQIGDHIAQQMFEHSLRFLRPGGYLCVVGNRHLGYHTTLAKRFTQCTTLHSDAKFVVLLATK